jgi:hypothetical protein
MVEEQARQFFRHLNRDFGNGRQVSGRFSPAFGGHYVDVLLSDLAAFNSWKGRIWRADEDEALQAVGQILDNRALLRGAGSSYPTMLMYLRDQRLWVIWGPITDRGLRNIVDSDHRRPGNGHLADTALLPPLRRRSASTAPKSS